MTDLPLNVVSETASTVTLGWTPPPAVCRGYIFRANGKRSSTLDPTRNTVKFAKPGPYEVEALGTLAQGVYPPPPPPSATVREVFPGQWSAVYAQAAAGDMLLLRGGVHPKITLDRSFPADKRVTVTCDPTSLVKGVDLVGNAGGYEFELFYTRLLPADVADLTSISPRAFNINGPVHDIRVTHSKIEGGYIGFSPYAGAPDFCTGIELLDSEVWGSWGDLIHSNGCRGLVIEHCNLHDPRHLTPEHHDIFQPQRTEDFWFIRNLGTWLVSEGHYTGYNDNYLGQAIMVSGGSGACKNGVIANNLVHHYNGRPLNLNGIAGLKVYNNTFLFSGDDVAITMGSGTSALEVWNNIGDTYWLEGPPPAFFDYNWLTKPYGTNIHGPHEWIGDPGLDSTFRPTASSPVRGKGVTRSGEPSVDIDGTPRTTPVLGCRL